MLLLVALAPPPASPASDQAGGGQGEYAGSKDKLHIYILVGQSNMSGRAKVEPEDRHIPRRLFLLDSRGKWVHATHPFVQYTNIPNSVDLEVIKAGGKVGLNFGLAFARRMLEANPDVAIGLVVNSKGGSVVETWKKRGKNSNYDKTMERVRPIRETGLIRGVLWHQGESDQKMGEAYLDALEPVIRQFRQDLRQPKLPFVAGQIAPQTTAKPTIDAFNRALLKLPSRVPNTAVARADDFTGNDKHFDSAETRKLGRRYAEQMLAIQGR
jgi:hypothetical protein